MAVESGKGGQLVVIIIAVILIAVLVGLTNQNKEIVSLKLRVDAVAVSVAKISSCSDKILALKEKLVAVEAKVNTVDGKLIAIENTFKNLSAVQAPVAMPEPEGMMEVPVTQP